MTEKTKDPEVIVDGTDPYAELPIDFEMVEVKKDDGKTDVDVKATDKDAAVTEKKADDDPIESLKRQLAEAEARAEKESRARTYAEQQAKELEGRYSNASNHTLASQLDSVQSAIELSKTKLENAQREWRDAQEVADWDAASKAQVKMSDAQLDLRTLESGKRELEYRRKSSQEKQTQTREPAGVDAMIDQTIEASSSKAQDYIRRNRDSLKSTDDVNLLYAAHNLALAKKHTADSPDYFAFIDNQMGWGDSEDIKPQQRQQQERTVSAPVARDTTAANGNLTNNRVTLTPQQVAIAKEMGITPSAYARNLMRIKSNGKDPNADGLRFSSDIRH
jgi:hypothetical protein